MAGSPVQRDGSRAFGSTFGAGKADGLTRETRSARRHPLAIEVKDTQDIIRQVVAQSREEMPEVAPLAPEEVGMATGPRFRKRALFRPGDVPAYIDPAWGNVESEQKLDDDIYKFLQLRRQQFSRLETPPSHQFIAEVEHSLRRIQGAEAAGSYLGLVRLAADVDLTRETLVTATEKSTLNALGRRLSVGKKADEFFDPRMVQDYLGLAASDNPMVGRGMADLLRLVARAARLPLLGNVQEAPAMALKTYLELVDVALRFNQAAAGTFDFQISPMDVFLGARSVLFNRSVANPTLTLMRELVLDEGGLYHDDLLDWLEHVGVFGSEATLLMPGKLAEEGYSLKGQSYSAVELVAAGGARLVKGGGAAEKAMVTLADALVHRVQRQDQHKDYQVKTLLQHFTRLMQGERRSAARIHADRQRVRFDYRQAIQRATEAAEDAQATGQFRAAGGTTRDDLEEWNTLLQKARKALGPRSPVFKTLAAQLARVRALDVALNEGLTPSGSRCVSRLQRLLQSDEVRRLLPFAAGQWRELENALEDGSKKTLAQLESLLLTLYGFPDSLAPIQFRHRDRHDEAGADAEIRWEPQTPDPSETGTGASDAEPETKEFLQWGREATFDEPVLRLVTGALLLESGGLATEVGNGSAPRRGQTEGDPFAAYAALLWVAMQREGDAARNPDAAARVMWEMDSATQSAWRLRREALARNLGPAQPPALDGMILREGWFFGCERGFMKEIRGLLDTVAPEAVEKEMLLRMTEIQPFLDRMTAVLEADKQRRTRDRLASAMA